MTASSISLAQALAGLPAFPALQRRGMLLRAPQADDADALFALFSHPDVTRYWSRPPMHTRAQAEGLLAEMLEDIQTRRMLHWLVTTTDDGVIGTCALFHFDGQHRCADIGYALHPDRWGRGLAHAAVGLVLDWGFPALRLQRIEADVDPRNQPSRRLLQRLGFRSEGVMRGRLGLGDTSRDAEVFALAAADWRNPAR